MNNLVKILLICLWLTYPLVAQQETVYRDAKYPFAFAYNPGEWQIEATSLPDSRIGLERTQDGERLATFSIRVALFRHPPAKASLSFIKKTSARI